MLGDSKTPECLISSLQPGDSLSASIRSLQQAIAQDPRHAGTWNHLGACLHKANQPVGAIKALLQAIALDPRDPHPYNNLGNVLLAEGSFEEAVEHYGHALALDPSCADAHSNLGAAHLGRCSYSRAIQHLSKAIKLQPEHADALGHLGAALSALGHQDAESYLRGALALQPGNATKQVNLALHLLRIGNFDEGLSAYESRWLTPELTPLQISQPLWLGDAPDTLRGTTGLLHAEQGLGDTLQFLRYLPMVLDLDARVIVEVQPQLINLVSQALARYPAVSRVIAIGDPRPPFDWHTPLLSLPLAFATTLETIPPPLRFIQHRVSRPAGNCVRVGLVWAGNQHHVRDRERSMPLAALEPLLNISNVEFVSLQKGPAADQVAKSGLPINTPALDDFSDTATVLGSLDLVVGVDTAVVHLAASEEIPTWLLLPLSTDWRWGVRITHPQGWEGSPWYKSIRIFQQSKLPSQDDPSASWRDIVPHVAFGLERWKLDLQSHQPRNDER